MKTYFKNCGNMEVHPLRSCLSVKINSKVETVFGSVFVDAIFLVCPISSSKSIMILHPLMPHASSSLLISISTPILWSSSHGSKTSVQANKWRCFASRSVFVNMSATFWMASSLNVGRWNRSSSSSWRAFVLFGGVSVAGVQLDPENRRNKKLIILIKNLFQCKQMWGTRFQFRLLTVHLYIHFHPFTISRIAQLHRQQHNSPMSNRTISWFFGNLQKTVSSARFTCVSCPQLLIMRNGNRERSEHKRSILSGRRLSNKTEVNKIVCCLIRD